MTARWREVRSEVKASRTCAKTAAPESNDVRSGSPPSRTANDDDSCCRCWWCCGWRCCRADIEPPGPRGGRSGEVGVDRCDPVAVVTGDAERDRDGAILAREVAIAHAVGPPPHETSRTQ